MMIKLYELSSLTSNRYNECCYEYRNTNQRTHSQQRRSGTRNPSLHFTFVYVPTIVLLAITFYCCQSNAFIINPTSSRSNPVIQRIQNPTIQGSDVSVPKTKYCSCSSSSRTSSTRGFGWQLLMSVSSSKTGGRLIESAEQYFEIVMADDDDSSSNQPQRPILVFWTAPWCGPCRLSIPVVKDIMKQFANKIDVYEVCTDDLPDVASDAGVVSIPTIHLYYRGKLLDTIIGCVAKTVLASSVDKALEDIALQNGGSFNDNNNNNNKPNGEQ